MTDRGVRIRANRSANFTLDPYDWISGTSGEDHYDADDAGFFHVTTRVAAVRRTGLRSRKQLREQKVVGLGGGYKDEAPDHISFVWSLSRAKWLAKAMRVACLAAHNAISATEVVQAVLEWTDFPGGQEWSMLMDEVSEEEVDEVIEGIFRNVITGDPWPGMEWVDLLATGGTDEWVSYNAETIDSEHPSGRMKYRLIQSMETVLDETTEQWRGSMSESEPECISLVGFTADHSVFVNADPSEIAIVQAAVRIGAPMDLVTRECELRFHSDDVELVSSDVEHDGPMLAEGDDT